MKEKLQEYALIAEIVSATAIVISLIFVGLQVNQAAEETSLNTRTVQIGAYQDLVAQISTISHVVVENPQFAELLARDNPETPQEIRQLRAYFLSAFRHGELAYLQFENGLIDERSARNMLTIVFRVLELSEFGRATWEISQNSLNPQYVEFVEISLAESIED